MEISCRFLACFLFYFSTDFSPNWPVCHGCCELNACRSRSRSRRGSGCRAGGWEGAVALPGFKAAWLPPSIFVLRESRLRLPCTSCFLSCSTERTQSLRTSSTALPGENLGSARRRGFGTGDGAYEHRLSLLFVTSGCPPDSTKA